MICQTCKANAKVTDALEHFIKHKSLISKELNVAGHKKTGQIEKKKFTYILYQFHDFFFW